MDSGLSTVCPPLTLWQLVIDTSTQHPEVGKWLALIYLECFLKATQNTHK